MSSTLKILREVNNYTQYFIAQEVLGIGQNTYCRLEQNPNKITAEQAKKLSKLYKVSIVNLVSDVPPVLLFEDFTTTGKDSQAGRDELENSGFNELIAKTLKVQNEFLTWQTTALAELLEAIKNLVNTIQVELQHTSTEKF
jgi:transcriptional regulator with XRE-family HTH domain